MPKGGGPPPPPVKKLNVRHLQWKGLQNATEDSFWAQDSILEIDLDDDELLNVFGNQASSSKKVQQVTKLKKTAVRLLDSKKAQNLEIATKSLKLRPTELVGCILRVDMNTLGDSSESLVDALLKYNPSKDETAKLKGYNGPFEDLGPAEQLWLSLLPVRRLDKKLRLLQFRVYLAERAGPLEDKIKFVASLSQKVQGSVQLPVVLRFVLAIGNKLNQGTNRAKAKAITPDDLIIAGRTKGFMQFLCKVIEERRSELLDFWEEFMDDGRNLLAETLKVDRDGLESQVKELEKGMGDVEVEFGHLKTEKEADDGELALREREKMAREDEDGKGARHKENLRKKIERDKLLAEDLRITEARAEGRRLREKAIIAMRKEDEEARHRLEEAWRMRRIEAALALSEEREDEKKRIIAHFCEKVEREKCEFQEMLQRLEKAAMVEAEKIEKKRQEKERLKREKKAKEEEEVHARIVKLEQEEKDRREKEEQERLEQEENERKSREEIEEQRQEAARLVKELQDMAEKERLAREETERLQQEEKERQEREERENALALLQQKLKSGEIKMVPEGCNGWERNGNGKLPDVNLESGVVLGVDLKPEPTEWGEENYELARNGGKSPALLAQSLAVWLSGQYGQEAGECFPEHEKVSEEKDFGGKSNGVDGSALSSNLEMNGYELSFSRLAENKERSVGLGNTFEEKKTGAMEVMLDPEEKFIGRNEEENVSGADCKVEAVEDLIPPVGPPGIEGTSAKMVENHIGRSELETNGMQTELATKEGKVEEQQLDVKDLSVSGVEMEEFQVVRSDEDESLEERRARQEKEWQEEAERERRVAEERHEQDKVNREKRAKERQERIEKERQEAEERAKMEKLEEELRLAKEWRRQREEIDTRAGTFWAVEAFLHEEVAPIVTDLRASMTLLGDSSIALAKFFGVDPKTSCNEIFGILFDFIELFKKASAENERRKRAEVEKVQKQAEAEARRKRLEEKKQKQQEVEQRRRRPTDIGRESILKDSGMIKERALTLRIPSTSPSPSIFSPITTPGRDTPSTHSTQSPFASLSPIGSPLLRTPAGTPPLTSPRNSANSAASGNFFVPYPQSLTAPPSYGTVNSSVGSPSSPVILLSSPALEKFRKRGIVEELDSSDDDSFDEERPRKARFQVSASPNGMLQMKVARLEHSPSTPTSRGRQKVTRVRHVVNGKVNRVVGASSLLVLEKTEDAGELLHFKVKKESKLAFPVVFGTHKPCPEPSESSLLVVVLLCIYWLASPSFFRRAEITTVTRRLLAFESPLREASSSTDSAADGSSPSVLPSSPYLAPIMASSSRKSRLSRSVSYGPLPEDDDTASSVQDGASSQCLGEHRP